MFVWNLQSAYASVFVWIIWYLHNAYAASLNSSFLSGGENQNPNSAAARLVKEAAGDGGSNGECWSRHPGIGGAVRSAAFVRQKAGRSQFSKAQYQEEAVLINPEFLTWRWATYQHMGCHAIIQSMLDSCSGSHVTWCDCRYRFVVLIIESLDKHSRFICKHKKKRTVQFRTLVNPGSRS